MDDLERRGAAGRVVPLVSLVLVAAVFVWSGLRPKDRVTWVLEVFPVMVAVPLLMVTRRRFPLTDLAYILVAIHCVILMIGGKYTYAEVPAFNWLRDRFHLARNHYDRLGHFAQGFVPAILAREVLVRRSPVKGGKWLAFLVFCVCMTVSALYELFEFGAAMVGGQGADAFLGGQGDPWDTQKDMLCCLVGSICALVLLSRWHDRQLREVRT